MPTTRNAILNVIKDGLIGLASLHADRVRIGTFRPDQATADPRVMIFWRGDFGTRKEGINSEREMYVIVAVIGVSDAGEATGDLEQLSEMFDLIHAKVEALADDDLSASVLEMKEVSPGIEPSGFDGYDNVHYVGCTWRVQYQRALEAT